MKKNNVIKNIPINKIQNYTFYVIKQNSGNPSGKYNIIPYTTKNNIKVINEDSDSSSVFTLDKDSI